jgi:hypothetical protein
MRKTAPVMAVLRVAGLTFIGPLGASETSWAKLRRPLHLPRPRARDSMPGEPNRSAHRLEARQHLRRERDRARARLPRPRLIGRTPHDLQPRRGFCRRGLLASAPAFRSGTKSSARRPAQFVLPTGVVPDT